MTTQQENGNTLWLTAFTPNGFKVSITLIIDPAKIPSAAQMDALMSEAGYTPNLIELDKDTSIEEIDAVVRSVTSKGDTVIYCYNTRLEWKLGQLYLDDASDKTAFESVAGIKLDSLLLYEGQGAPQRKNKNPTKWEKQVRPFKITKTIIGQDDQGNNRYKYALHGHTSAPTQPAPAPQSAPSAFDNLLGTPAKQAFKTPAIKREFMERCALTADDVKPLQAFLGVKSLAEDYGGTLGELVMDTMQWKRGADIPL